MLSLTLVDVKLVYITPILAEVSNDRVKGGQQLISTKVVNDYIGLATCQSKIYEK